MKTFPLQRYILLSVVVHLLVLWLLSFSSPYEPMRHAPVVIRMLNPPPLSDLQALPPAPKVAELKRQPPTTTAPEKVHKKGGILAELPKPLHQERPKDARLVSKYDSTAQDIGSGSARAQKPSGQMTRLLPPELELPERYSQSRPKTPPQKTAPPPPSHAAPFDRAPLQARRMPTPRPADQPDVEADSPRVQKPATPTSRLVPPPLELPEHDSVSRPKTPPQKTTLPPLSPSPSFDRSKLQARRMPMSRPDEREKNERPVPLSKERLPKPTRDRQVPLLAPTPELRQFPITDEQELNMVQRDQSPPEQRQSAPDEQNNLSDHFARLEKRQPLPLPTFDAPGVYPSGPERRGEGRAAEGGGKYRSIDAYGLKHFSYLVGVKRKIELLFSVPFFMPNQGAVGVPVVGFTIRRNGVLSEAILLRSSGYATLDKALLDAVRRAAPYGPFPQHLADPEISIRVYATVS